MTGETTAGRVVTALRRNGIWLATAALALLAYVPALRSSPGRMPADTKLYLYLDPNRLISDAPWTFDARQFAGSVPHQVIAYLWPQGPWFSLGDAAGLPDWIVHRLWIGSLLFAAGAGVLWTGRRFGLGVVAAFVAAVVYQLAPYVLPYVSRTSAMLLPWAALGWIVGLVALAATRSRWRHAALLALVVATVGAVNATALLMVAAAPVLWLVVAAAERRISWRRAVATAAKVGVLSLGMSLWWIVAVIIQGRLGAPVLDYTESLESVSFTSTAPEVWRGLGYWLTYIRDPFAPTTTAGGDYLVSLRLIAVGFVLLVVALLGLVLTRWHQQRFGLALVVTGVVLGVGVHPFDDPSPLMALLAGDGDSGPALALRSSTRAVPMLVLGLALGAGALIDAIGAVQTVLRQSLRVLAAAAVIVLAIANLPALTGFRLVDPALDRQEEPPAAWLEAAAALDAAPSGFRVLQLPGAEFGAFRWGYTVDPPLPGLTERPLVTRDLQPLGSAAAMDLLYALDDRFQTGVAEPSSVAPIARLFGADTIWLTGDAAFERFRTPRPELVHDFFAAAPGLRPPVTYGTAMVNKPSIPMVDEQSVSDVRVAQPIAPVELVPVLDPVGVIRVKDREVVVAGNGDGLVDAAAAGLIDGQELVRYSASLDDVALTEAVDGAALVVVTDSNRLRARHWRSSQDVHGFTEDLDVSANALRWRDVADERLPVFETGRRGAETWAQQRGPVRATATGYGEPFAYRPEQRPFMAVDGDPATAWVVGDRSDPIGEQLRLEISEPIDHVSLRQPDGADAVRHVGEVTVDVDGTSQTVALDERSFDGRGQRIEFVPTDGPSVVTLTIDSVVVPDPTIGPALAAVGFAEVDVGLDPTIEVVHVPTDATTALEATPSTPLAYAFSRLRTRPTDRWRSDPEPTMVREFEVPDDRAFAPAVTVRLDQRAPDDVLAELLGIQGPLASDRLTGVAAAAGWATTDGDPATAWITPFGGAVGARLELPLVAPLTTLSLTQPSGAFSPITGLRLTSGEQVLDVVVPAPDPDGRSTIELTTALDIAQLELEITAIDERIEPDRRYAEPVALPAAISELSMGTSIALPEQLDTGCRDDLVEIDGRPIPVQVIATVADLLAGAAVVATPCGPPDVALDRGDHVLSTSAGTGLHVDRVTFTQPPQPVEPPAPRVEVTSTDRTSRTVTVNDCGAGCWLVLGEGFNEAWSASTADGADLGPPQLVDGGFNGWRLPPTAGPITVTMRWTAQTPQTVALIVSAVTIALCLALAALDRRVAPAVVASPARFGGNPGGPPSSKRRWVIAGIWVVASALLVGPGWGLLAAVAAGLLVVSAGRPRLAGLVSVALLVVIGAVIGRVVQRERPFPDAGWPARFEWLHGLGLFAAVCLLVALFADQQPPQPVDTDGDGPAGEDGQQR